MYVRCIKPSVYVFTNDCTCSQRICQGRVEYCGLIGSGVTFSTHIGSPFGAIWFTNGSVNMSDPAHIATDLRTGNLLKGLESKTITTRYERPFSLWCMSSACLLFQCFEILPFITRIFCCQSSISVVGFPWWTTTTENCKKSLNIESVATHYVRQRLNLSALLLTNLF